MRAFVIVLGEFSILGENPVKIRIFLSFSSKFEHITANETQMSPENSKEEHSKYPLNWHSMRCCGFRDRDMTTKDQRLLGMEGFSI